MGSLQSVGLGAVNVPDPSNQCTNISLDEGATFGPFLEPKSTKGKAQQAANNEKLTSSVGTSHLNLGSITWMICAARRPSSSPTWVTAGVKDRLPRKVQFI